MFLVKLIADRLFRLADKLVKPVRGATLREVNLFVESDKSFNPVNPVKSTVFKLLEFATSEFSLERPDTFNDVNLLLLT